ncbi:PA1571 family protein [Acinetobacter sp. CFCC 10889]|uniref:PA1571 family protein n=1 Tax=Acinetobacter sp. CFCC 10889 TaxID=1775557 RepID=UPI00148C4312|nr:PA1571 family protein [Acinetobacter sp. CFCC 10889]
MTVSEKIITRNLQHVLDSQPKNTCVMLDENGKEVNITKDMVVTMCHQLLKQCRNIKN